MARLAEAIERLGRFFYLIVVVPAEVMIVLNPPTAATAWRPCGSWVPGPSRPWRFPSPVAHRVLVLNTEKAHNLRERPLQVARPAEALVGAG